MDVAPSFRVPLFSMRTALLSVLFTATLSSTAVAHIDMLSPTPRYPEEVALDNKACPCGVGASNRLCNVEGDRSDPDRASEDRITELTAGGTVTVRFDEYVGHTGRYRVAIDYDGADLEDFNANPLLDVPDPPGNTGNTGGGSIWELEVPLPNVNCDNCTLQLIQMMDGNQDDPVDDPVNRSTYYTCADIRLVGANTSISDAGANPGGADAGSDSAAPASGSGCRSGGPTTALGLLGVFAALVALRRRRVGSLTH